MHTNKTKWKWHVDPVHSLDSHWVIQSQPSTIILLHKLPENHCQREQRQNLNLSFYGKKDNTGFNECPLDSINPGQRLSKEGPKPSGPGRICHQMGRLTCSLESNFIGLQVNRPSHWFRSRRFCAGRLDIFWYSTDQFSGSLKIWFCGEPPLIHVFQPLYHNLEF